MNRRNSFALILTLVAGPVHAAGINLSWNDCGTAGMAVETFACNSNVGVHSLFASFVSPVPMTQFVGIELAIDMQFDQATVPSWWTLQSSGGCRNTSLTSSADFLSAGPYTCGDSWQGNALTAASVQVGVPSPNRVRIRGIAGVGNMVMTIDDVTEYYAFRINVNNQRTVGTGSCGGCDVGGCMTLSFIKLYQTAGVGDHTIFEIKDNPIVGWQCPAQFGTPSPQCFLCPVPARPQTWGSIKGLYR